MDILGKVGRRASPSEVMGGMSVRAFRRGMEQARHHPYHLAALLTREMARTPYLRRYGRFGAAAYKLMTGKEAGHHGFR